MPIQPPPIATPVLVGPNGTISYAWEQFFRSIVQDLTTSAEARGTLANKPTTLKVNDEGFLYFATDYARLFRWTGSAWERAPGEMPTLMLGLFGLAPGTGWKLLDGSGNPFTYTTATAGTATITIQDARTYFVRMVSSFTGNQVAAVAPGATGPTISTDSTGITATDSGAASLGGPSGTTVVNAGAGATVASSTHNHTDAGHTHGITDPQHTHTPGAVTVDATGEPKYMGFLPYIRL